MQLVTEIHTHFVNNIPSTSFSGRRNVSVKRKNAVMCTVLNDGLLSPFFQSYYCIPKRHINSFSTTTNTRVSLFVFCCLDHLSYFLFICTLHYCFLYLLPRKEMLTYNVAGAPGFENIWYHCDSYHLFICDSQLRLLALSSFIARFLDPLAISSLCCQWRARMLVRASLWIVF